MIAWRVGGVDSPLSERLRWRVANVLNRSPRYCWSDLVSWVVFHFRGENEALRTGSSARCKLDAAESGSCYCGKFRAPAEGTP